jgi:beta-lactamase regulating signal transducer with metallopeptidase domain
MISVFVEAALRSLLAGLAVALGLRLFRIGNVLAQKTAWGLVLVSAFAMPLLLPVTATWNLLPTSVSVVLPADPMAGVEHLEARIEARIWPGSKLAQRTAPAPQTEVARIAAARIDSAGIDSAGMRKPPAPRLDAEVHASEAPFPTTRMRPSANPEPATALIPDKSAPSSAQSISCSAPLVQKSQFLSAIKQIRSTPIILALTIYGGIAALLFGRLILGLFTTIRLWRTATAIPANLLPREAASLQLRASSKVASPVTIGSAILLPADFTRWEVEKLRIVLAHERSHVRQGDFYLQLLASVYAAFVWFSPLGWWLKHELAELAEAISDRAGIEEAASRAAYAQILLEFAAAPRRVTIGVAMARPGSLSRRIERLLNDHSFRKCFAGGRRSLAAIALVPLALLASTTLIRVQAAADTHSHSSAAVAAPAATVIEHSDSALPQLQPATRADSVVLPDSQAPALEPASEMVAIISPEPAIGVAPAVTLAASSVQQGDSLSFERTLSASGAAQLTVSTGSGNIHIRRGSGNQVHIHGHIHVSHEGSEDEARQIAANPPIEQSGDSIRVGPQHEHWRGISIDYEIEAPAGTLLAANSGSGDVVDEGVGQNAKLQTGSGDIRATGLEGPFTVRTGSGNISAEQTGQGDVVAETGSGAIELKNIHGGFRGQTGSGDIKATGTPTASWNLQTGSGNIELWTGNAPLTLEATTASGSVTTAHEMTVKGSFDHHHIQGTLNGGGPTIRAQTGSGDIQMH